MQADRPRARASAPPPSGGPTPPGRTLIVNRDPSYKGTLGAYFTCFGIVLAFAIAGSVLLNASPQMVVLGAACIAICAAMAVVRFDFVTDPAGRKWSFEVSVVVQRLDSPLRCIDCGEPIPEDSAWLLVHGRYMIGTTVLTGDRKGAPVYRYFTIQFPACDPCFDAGARIHRLDSRMRLANLFALPLLGLLAVHLDRRVLDGSFLVGMGLILAAQVFLFFRRRRAMTYWNFACDTLTCDTVAPGSTRALMREQISEMPGADNPLEAVCTVYLHAAEFAEDFAHLNAPPSH